MTDTDRSNSEGLAGRAAAQDDAAFADLFRRVRGRLEMWIATRMGPMLRSRLAVEDVLQETFLQAHRSLASFTDRGPGSFLRWMFSVAENRILDLNKYHSAQMRTPRREKAAEAGESLTLWQTLSTAETSPSGRAHRAEMLHRLSEAIDRLPPELREVLVRRAIAEETFRDIGQTTDTRPDNVSGLYTRALRKLRDELRTETTR